MNILNAANSLIRNNTSRREKTLVRNTPFRSPLYVERHNEKDEVIYVVDEIQNELIKEHRQGF